MRAQKWRNLVATGAAGIDWGREEAEHTTLASAFSRETSKETPHHDPFSILGKLDPFPPS